MSMTRQRLDEIRRYIQDGCTPLEAMRDLLGHVDEQRAAYESICGTVGMSDSPEGTGIVICARLDELCMELRRLVRVSHERSDEKIPMRRETWHEDDGAVLWWKFPIAEPPYVGSPLHEDFPDHVTHWTRMPEPFEPIEVEP